MSGPAPSLSVSKPGDFDAGLARAREAAVRGDYGEARAQLATIEGAAWDDAHNLRCLAEFYSHMSCPVDAERCCARAVELAPGDGRARYDLAAASIALGRIDAAEGLLDHVIADAPADWDAWANRSTLRRATAAIPAAKASPASAMTTAASGDSGSLSMAVT